MSLYDKAGSNDMNTQSSCYVFSKNHTFLNRHISKQIHFIFILLSSFKLVGHVLLFWFECCNFIHKFCFLFVDILEGVAIFEEEWRATTICRCSAEKVKCHTKFISIIIQIIKIISLSVWEYIPCYF